jgi:hypothetical protein
MMQRRRVLGFAMYGLVAGLLGAGTAAQADGYRISGPVSHGNLTIYLVHGKSAPGPVPLTLQEAMTGGSVLVHETSNVNELQIENTGDSEVFVQSGDIVKGGKQDRVLMVSLVVPPKSGRMPIASFCVEQGRWQARGGENVQRFASADAALPSRKAKIAMKATRQVENTGGNEEPGSTRTGRVIRGPQNETALRQRDVWANVAEMQSKFARGVGTASVAAPQSASSLQLSLENEKLKEKKRLAVNTLRAAGLGDDVIGFAFAVNGKLNSADVYPSHGLFAKMWEKLLDAAVTEAIGETDNLGAPLPSTDVVLAFLDNAERGAAQPAKTLTPGVSLASRESDKSLYFATERSAGGWVHRNYLAK